MKETLNFDERFYLKEFGIKCEKHSPCNGFDCVKSYIRELLESLRELIPAMGEHEGKMLNSKIDTILKNL